jgi:hypothetical protein
VNDDLQRFLETITPAKRAGDAAVLLRLMQEVTGEKPGLQGTIIGFGSYHYKYASGREGDAPAAGFAPRKAATTIYLMDGVAAHSEQLARLGPHATGVGCVYIKDLDLIDLDVLRAIVGASYATLTAGTYGMRAREGGSPAGRSVPHVR